VEETYYKTLQVRIKYLNIDNNSKYDAYHPVILTPALKSRYLFETNSHYFFDFILKYNDKLDQLTWLHCIEIYIMPFAISLEEDFIEMIYEWYFRVFNFSEINKKASQTPLINKLFLIEHPKNAIENQKAHKYDWEWVDIPESKSLYIDEFILPAIEFTFTFNKKLVQDTKKYNLGLEDFSLIRTIAEIFGTTFQNVNEAPILLKGLRVRYIFDSKKGVIDRFVTHYQENIISTILKIIGSINIIGNPIGLLRYIGSGVVDLIEKPIEGVQRGPLGLGIGVFEGGSSFLKKTFAGTFNSISALTETMGTGFTMLTFDDKYIQKRSKMMLNKPKHVFDGLYEGGRSLIKGLKSGVKSAFLLPKEGIEKDGYPGLLKGSIQGLTGLMIKPIGGVFDATAKTAEGLKNTATYYDDKPNNERHRPPRVFYETERFIKRYDKRDAKLMINLQKVEKGMLGNIRFLEVFEKIEYKKKEYSMVLSYEYVLLMPVKGDYRGVVKIPAKNIGDCMVKEEKLCLRICILLKDEEKNNNVMEKFEIVTEIGSQETKNNRMIPESLQMLRDYYQEKERENNNLMEGYCS